MKRRKKYGVWIVILLLALLVSGCTGSKTPPDLPGGGQDVTEPNGPGKENGETEGPEGSAPEDPDGGEPGPDEGDETPAETPAEKPAPYAAEEIVPVFETGEEEVLTLYGEPEVKTPVDLFWEDSAVEYRYDTGTVFCFEYVSDLTKATLYEAMIADDQIPAPRGIKIGDAAETVLARFPDEGSTERHASDEGNGREYRMLYGEYLHMSDFGLIEYDGDTPVKILYSSEGTALIFELANGKVSRVHYNIPLT